MSEEVQIDPQDVIQSVIAQRNQALDRVAMLEAYVASLKKQLSIEPEVEKDSGE